MPKCKTCGKEILFVKTADGRHMPCDAQRVYYRTNGHKQDTVITPKGATIRCEVLKSFPTIGEPVLFGCVPHWITCKNAAAFRTERASSCQHYRPYIEDKKPYCLNCESWDKKKATCKRQKELDELQKLERRRA